MTHIPLVVADEIKGRGGGGETDICTRIVLHSVVGGTCCCAYAGRTTGLVLLLVCDPLALFSSVCVGPYSYLNILKRRGGT